MIQFALSSLLQNGPCFVQSVQFCVDTTQISCRECSIVQPEGCLEFRNSLVKLSETPVIDCEVVVGERIAGVRLLPQLVRLIFLLKFSGGESVIKRGDAKTLGFADAAP